jgi:biotin-(acetyl-CoA carboxylase) ligase
MTVNTGTGPAAGAFAGLDADGALLIRSDDGTVLRYTFGDVALAGQSV